MRLFVGCSSRNEIPDVYKKKCENYLKEVFDMDADLVFGADCHSIMKISYDVVKNKGGKVIGITPDNFKDSIGNLEYDELIFTKNISERTYEVIKRSDVLIFLPGIKLFAFIIVPSFKNFGFSCWFGLLIGADNGSITSTFKSSLYSFVIGSYMRYMPSLSIIHSFQMLTSLFCNSLTSFDCICHIHNISITAFL